MQKTPLPPKKPLVISTARDGGIHRILKIVFLNTILMLNITFGHEFVSIQLWITATNLSHATIPPTKFPLLGLSTGTVLSSTLIEVAEIERLQRKKKEGCSTERNLEREGAKRQTRCVFCLDLNRAERKGVGVRSRVCEEKKEGKQVGESEVFFFSLYFFSSGTDDYMKKKKKKKLS